MLCIFLLQLQAFNVAGEGWISMSHHMLHTVIPTLQYVVILVIHILDSIHLCKRVD